MSSGDVVANARRFLSGTKSRALVPGQPTTNGGTLAPYSNANYAVAAPAGIPGTSSALDRWAIDQSSAAGKGDSVFANPTYLNTSAPTAFDLSKELLQAGEAVWVQVFFNWLNHRNAFLTDGTVCKITYVTEDVDRFVFNTLKIEGGASYGGEFSQGTTYRVIEGRIVIFLQRKVAMVEFGTIAQRIKAGENFTEILTEIMSEDLKGGAAQMLMVALLDSPVPSIIKPNYLGGFQVKYEALMKPFISRWMCVNKDPYGIVQKIVSADRIKTDASGLPRRNVFIASPHVHDAVNQRSLTNTTYSQAGDAGPENLNSSDFSQYKKRGSIFDDITFCTLGMRPDYQSNGDITDQIAAICEYTVVGDTVKDPQEEFTRAYMGPNKDVTIPILDLWKHCRDIAFDVPKAVFKGPKLSDVASDAQKISLAGTFPNSLAIFGIDATIDSLRKSVLYFKNATGGHDPVERYDDISVEHLKPSTIDAIVDFVIAKMDATLKGSIGGQHNVEVNKATVGDELIKIFNATDVNTPFASASRVYANPGADKLGTDLKKAVKHAFLCLPISATEKLIEQGFPIPFKFVTFHSSLWGGNCIMMVAGGGQTAMVAAGDVTLAAGENADVKHGGIYGDIRVGAAVHNNQGCERIDMALGKSFEGGDNPALQPHRHMPHPPETLVDFTIAGIKNMGTLVYLAGIDEPLEKYVPLLDKVRVSSGIVREGALAPGVPVSSFVHFVDAYFEPDLPLVKADDGRVEFVSRKVDVMYAPLVAAPCSYKTYHKSGKVREHVVEEYWKKDWAFGPSLSDRLGMMGA